MNKNALVVRAALLAGAVTLAPVSLHGDEPRLDCRDGGRTQLEMSACAGKRADAAQKRLVALLAELEGALEPRAREGLAEVQRRWAEVREMDCHWERSMFEGGSAASQVYATCIATQTEQRIDRLKLLLCEGAGMTGPCEASRKH